MKAAGISEVISSGCFRKDVAAGSRSDEGSRGRSVGRRREVQVFAWARLC